MLREHAPLIAVSVAVAVLFYLVFRDLKAVRADLDSLAPLAYSPDAEPALEQSPTPEPVRATAEDAPRPQASPPTPAFKTSKN